MTAAMETQHGATSTVDGREWFARCWNGARNLNRSEVRDQIDSRGGATARDGNPASVTIRLGMFGHKPAGDGEALVVTGRRIHSADSVKARHRKHDQ